MAVLSHLAKQKTSFLTAEQKINDSAGEYGLHGMLTPYLLYNTSRQPTIGLPAYSGLRIESHYNLLYFSSYFLPDPPQEVQRPSEQLGQICFLPMPKELS